MVNKKNIVVVGGTSGIGLATVESFKKLGCKIYSGGRRNQNIDGVESIVLDVTSEDSVKEFIEKIEKIDSIIYCAGVAEKADTIENFDLKSHQNTFSTNVSGLMLILKYAYPKLRDVSGSVVVINSIAGRSLSRFSNVDYTASKFALRGVVNQLATDFAVDSVRINALYPSMTKTPMLESRLGEEQISDLEKSMPLKRLVEMDDIFNTIEFLISDKSSYITGTGIDINGGLLPNA